MLQPDQEGEIPFKTAIKCAGAVLMNKIVATETDLVGIVLYGTVCCIWVQKIGVRNRSDISVVGLVNTVMYFGHSLGEIKELQQL